jgi:1-acyl-sn-glycerol-3-phosphate acyltransferase
VADARVFRLSEADPARDNPAPAAPSVQADPAIRLVRDEPVPAEQARPATGEARVDGDDDIIDLTSPQQSAAPAAPAADDTIEIVPDGPAVRPAPATTDGMPSEWAAALAALERAASAGDPLAEELRRLAPGESPDWERKLAGALAFLRRRLTGDYEVDEYGFDADLTEHVLATVLRPVYEKWFRVETRGMENLPDEGSALIVGNHSGTIPIDAAMTTLAVYDHHPAHRHLRLLAADLVFQLPFLAPLARKAGNTLACQADAERLLSSGELVGVWPEGFKGIGKPYSERYKLQRFGRGGFVSSALRTGAPIIPCSLVGAEEIYPMLGNLKTIARIVGLPYLPVTPTFPLLGPLGLIPLPSKWIIEFGEPVETASYGSAAADDPMTVFNLTDQVRETIQGTLYKLLMQRRSVFF